VYTLFIDPYEVVLDVSQESVAIALGILLGGKGQAWISEVQFEEVGADVPTTSHEGYGELPEKPGNLDFVEDGARGGITSSEREYRVKVRAWRGFVGVRLLNASATEAGSREKSSWPLADSRVRTHLSTIQYALSLFKGNWPNAFFSRAFSKTSCPQKRSSSAILASAVFGYALAVGKKASSPR
jgi:hypothetical protein